MLQEYTSIFAGLNSFVQNFMDRIQASERVQKNANFIFDTLELLGGVKLIACLPNDSILLMRIHPDCPDPDYCKEVITKMMTMAAETQPIPTSGVRDLFRGKLFGVRTGDQLGSYFYIELFGDHMWTAEKLEFVSTALMMYTVIKQSAINFRDMRNNQSTLTSVLNNINSLIYVSDIDTGEILFINDAMKNAFDLENATGQVCWQVLQTDMSKPCSFCPIQKLTTVDSPPIVWEEYNTVTKRYYQNTDRLIHWIDNKVVHVQHSVDITDLKAAQQGLYAALDELSSYNKLLNSLHAIMDVQDAFAQTTEMLCESYRCQRVSIGMIFDDDLCDVVGSYCQITKSAPNTGQLLSCGPLLQKITSPDTLYLIDQSIAAAVLPVCDYAKRVYVLGLFLNGTLCGFLSLEYHFETTISEKEQSILCNTAHLIENLVMRKNIEDQREQFAEALEEQVAVRTAELVNMTTMAEEARHQAEGARKLAEEATIAKSMFLANMSHEIRTPMNSIVGMADLLLAEKLTAKQERFVKDLQMAAVSLLGIINDILDQSKIESGKMVILPVHFDLTLMLENIISIMTFNAKSKGLTFINALSLREIEPVLADDVRIKQVIINLLSNAIKFTAEGSVTLGCIITDGLIRITVEDTGIGIKPEEQNALFMPFSQLDTQRNRNIKGTGLGLTITKSLVEIMGGRVFVQSAYGKGTKFTVELPYKEGDPYFIAAETVFQYISAPTARVLIVDDIQTNLTVGAGLLHLCNITSDVALNGFEAIKMVSATDYDLVLMDHMMPEMDGVETTKRIRDLGEKYLSLPIVALTANALYESREFLLQEGLDDFLAKPIDKNLLIAMLRKWLPAEKIEEISLTESTSPAVHSEILTAAATINALDIEMALDRLDNMQNILEVTLKQLTVSLADSAQKLQDFLSIRDLHNFGVLVHGLKSSLASVGAMALSEQAMSLEIAAKSNNVAACEANFPTLHTQLLSLHEQLMPLFPEKSDTAKPEGNQATLTAHKDVLQTHLANFEMDAALQTLDLLDKHDYGARASAIISEVRQQVEAFDFDAALESLSAL